MPIGPKKMPFLSHLAELRQRILVITLTVSIAACIAYPFTANMLGWLFEPIRPYLPQSQIYITGPFEAFMFRFKIATFGAIIVTSPVWLYQMLAFFLPALKDKERKYFLPTFFAILALFLSGNLFCHYIILPPSFQWLMAQTTGGGIDLRVVLHSWFHIGPATPAKEVSLAVLPHASDFLGGVMLMMLAFGFAFELPVLLYFLIGVGVVKYHVLRRNWRYVYLGLITFSSMATPDWSPITIGALFICVTVLYEVTMLLARQTFRERIKDQIAAAAEAG